MPLRQWAEGFIGMAPEKAAGHAGPLFLRDQTIVPETPGTLSGPTTTFKVQYLILAANLCVIANHG